MAAHRETSQTPERERLVDGEFVDLSELPGAGSETSPDARGAERRRFERLYADKTVRITELDGFGNPGATWECRVVDISRGGLGMRSRRMVHCGRNVIIEVPNVGGRTKVLCGTVRQSRYAEGEGYVVGLQFIEVPQSHAVRSWMTQRGLAA
jgi:hypothetical protein